MQQAHTHSLPDMRLAHSSVYSWVHNSAGPHWHETRPFLSLFMGSQFSRPTLTHILTWDWPPIPQFIHWFTIQQGSHSLTSWHEHRSFLSLAMPILIHEGLHWYCGLGSHGNVVCWAIDHNPWKFNNISTQSLSSRANIWQEKGV
jgi:hypothetical protein